MRKITIVLTLILVIVMSLILNGCSIDYDKAIADYTKAIEINPSDDYAYSFRGYAWMEKGDYDKAIADFTKAIGKCRVARSKGIIYTFRALAWKAKGDHGRAQKDMVRAGNLLNQ